MAAIPQEMLAETDFSVEDLMSFYSGREAIRVTSLYKVATGEDRSDGPMVVTNNSGMFGAGTLFIAGVAEKIYSERGEYYAIPSSLHEWIIIPKTFEHDAENLLSMVKKANDSVVPESDQLSDCILQYDGSKFTRIDR
jgi:hypothetical protein